MSIITHGPNNVLQLDQSIPLIFISFFYLFSYSQSSIVARTAWETGPTNNSRHFFELHPVAEHMEICAHVEYKTKLFLSLYILSIAVSVIFGPRHPTVTK